MLFRSSAVCSLFNLVSRGWASGVSHQVPALALYNSGLLTDPHHQSPFVATELEGVLSGAGSVGRGVCRPSSSLCSAPRFCPKHQPGTRGARLTSLPPSVSAENGRPGRVPTCVFSPRRELALAPGLTALPFLSQQVKLEEFGRPKIDGELKVRSIVNHTKQDR